MSFLLKYHTLNLLLNNQHSKKAKSHCFSLSNLTSKQQMKIKSSVVDSNNCLNRIFPLFDNLYQELSSGFHLVDNFSDYYSFYIVNYKNKEIKNAHIWNLDKIFEDTLSISELQKLDYILFSFFYFLFYFSFHFYFSSI